MCNVMIHFEVKTTHLPKHIWCPLQCVGWRAFYLFLSYLHNLRTHMLSSDNDLASEGNSFRCSPRTSGPRCPPSNLRRPRNILANISIWMQLDVKANEKLNRCQTTGNGFWDCISANMFCLFYSQHRFFTCMRPTPVYVFGETIN